MSASKTSALVYYGKELAGRLSRQQLPDGSASFEFEYLPDYLARGDAMPISLSMPLRKEIFSSKTLFPFFDGLLPEGWLLDLTTKALKIDKQDKFSLLRHTGTDTIGAVTVRPEPTDVEKDA